MGIIQWVGAGREPELLSNRVAEDVIASAELKPTTECAPDGLRHEEPADGAVTLEPLQPAFAR